MLTQKRVVVAIIAMLVAVTTMACGGPDAKKLKFYNKGLKFYEKGDYVKARLEFKNAVQIDIKYADAYYMLGMTAMKSGDPRGAYGGFSKAVELNPRHPGAQVQIGWFLLGSGKPDEAMEKVSLVLKDDPKYEDALLLKGAVLVKKNDSDGARRFLESVVGRDIRKADGYLFLTSLYQQKGDVRNAENSLLEGIKANERSIPLYLALADFYYKKKRTDDAVRLMQKVIELEPEVSQHRLALAEIYWTAGKEQEATDVLKSLVSADPKKEEGWIQDAEFYFSKKRPAEGEEQLKEGIRQNEKSFQIRFALSAFYFAANHADQGVSVLQECLKVERDPANPNIIHAKNSLAQFYLSREDIDKARQYVEEVIKESPKNVDANFIEGTIHLMRQEGVQATSAFRTVVSEQPQFIPGYVGLADAHALNKEMNLAFDTLQDAEKIAPESRDVARARARLYAKQNDFKNAQSQYRIILNKNPKDVEVRADLGDLMLAAGDLKRAATEYTAIKRSAANLPLGYVKLSALYGAQKKWDKAINELEQAVRIHPELWSTTNDLAYLLSEYGNGKEDLDRALVFAEKAKSLNPDNPAVFDTLGWLYYRKGDMNRAVELLGKAQAGNARNPVICYHLGMAYSRTGDSEKAKEYLKTALSSKVSFPGKDEAEKVMASIH